MKKSFFDAIYAVLPPSSLLEVEDDYDISSRTELSDKKLEKIKCENKIALKESLENFKKVNGNEVYDIYAELLSRINSSLYSKKTKHIFDMHGRIDLLFHPEFPMLDAIMERVLTDYLIEQLKYFGGIDNLTHYDLRLNHIGLIERYYQRQHFKVSSEFSSINVDGPFVLELSLYTIPLDETYVQLCLFQIEIQYERFHDLVRKGARESDFNLEMDKEIKLLIGLFLKFSPYFDTAKTQVELKPAFIDDALSRYMDKFFRLYKLIKLNEGNGFIRSQKILEDYLKPIFDKNKYLKNHPDKAKKLLLTTLQKVFGNLKLKGNKNIIHEIFDLLNMNESEAEKKESKKDEFVELDAEDLKKPALVLFQAMIELLQPKEETVNITDAINFISNDIYEFETIFNANGISEECALRILPLIKACIEVKNAQKSIDFIGKVRSMLELIKSIGGMPRNKNDAAVVNEIYRKIDGFILNFLDFRGVESAFHDDVKLHFLKFIVLSLTDLIGWQLRRIIGNDQITLDCVSVNHSRYVDVHLPVFHFLKANETVVKTHVLLLKYFLLTLNHGDLQDAEDANNLTVSIGNFISCILTMFILDRNKEKSNYDFQSIVKIVVDSPVSHLFNRFTLVNNKIIYTHQMVAEEDCKTPKPMDKQALISLLLTIVKLRPHAYNSTNSAYQFCMRLVSEAQRLIIQNEIFREFKTLYKVTLFVEGITPLLEANHLKLIHKPAENKFFIEPNNAEDSLLLDELYNRLKRKIGFNTIKSKINYSKDDSTFSIICDEDVERFILKTNVLNNLKKSKTTKQEYHPEMNIPFTLFKTPRIVIEEGPNPLDKIKKLLEGLGFSHDVTIHFNEAEKTYTLIYNFKEENQIYSLKIKNGSVNLNLAELNNFIIDPLKKLCNDSQQGFIFILHENKLFSPLFKIELTALINEINKHLRQKLQSQESIKPEISSIEEMPQQKEIMSTDPFIQLKSALYKIINDASLSITFGWLKPGNQISDKFFTCQIQGGEIYCHKLHVKCRDLISEIANQINSPTAFCIKENILQVSYDWLLSYEKEELNFDNLKASLQQWVKDHAITRSAPDLKKEKEPQRPLSGKKKGGRKFVAFNPGYAQAKMTSPEVIEKLRVIINKMLSNKNDFFSKKMDKEAAFKNEILFSNATFLLAYQALSIMENECGINNKKHIIEMALNLKNGAYDFDMKNTDAIINFFFRVSRIYNIDLLEQSVIAPKIENAIQDLNLLDSYRYSPSEKLNFLISQFTTFRFKRVGQDIELIVLDACVYQLYLIGKALSQLNVDDANFFNTLFEKDLKISAFFGMAKNIFETKEPNPLLDSSAYHDKIKKIFADFYICKPMDMRFKLKDVIDKLCGHLDNHALIEPIWGRS